MKYLRITRRIFGILGIRIRQGAVMVLLLALYAGLEGFGIGLLLPVLQYLEAGGGTVPSGGVWPYLLAVSGLIGLPITLGTLLLIAFIPIMARQAAYYANVRYTARVQNRAVEQLMVRAFRAVANARMSYIEERDPGELLSSTVGQVVQCGQALVTYLRLLGAAAIIAVYATLLALLSWQLAAIAVVAMGLVSWGVRRVLVASRVYGADQTQATVELVSAVRERLDALRLVKMRAREEEEALRIRTLAARLRDASVKISTAAARVEVFVDPALMLAVFVVVFVGVSQFGMTLASLGLFMFILLRLNAKVKEFNLGRQSLASLMPSFDYVEKALATAESASTSAGGSRPFTGLADEIRFRDVTFTYGPDQEPVLQGVTLAIPKGNMTAVVGKSGAGKSTLVDMIPMLRTPDSGQVMFDDVPASEFDLESLRKRIGFLTQEPILFNDTIYNNLVYGLDLEPASDQVRSALHAAHCDEFIDGLPDGLETRLGDRGVRFSGGQRQRLALARVLLEEPEILILDEPTSALDSESERYIQEALERLHGRATLVVIAHRLATVEKADQILVLADGRIVEVGTHKELLARGGHYERLFASQIRA